MSTLDLTAPYYPLWKLMHDEHKLLLLESEVSEIAEACRQCPTPKDILGTITLPISAQDLSAILKIHTRQAKRDNKKAYMRQVANRLEIFTTDH
jgi:hypothetical protein